jgi:alcohol dehydrogenase (NADP+)
VACLGSAYADLLQDGARFRARVNHVEQAFAPLVPTRAAVLARPLASTGAWMPLVGYGTAVFRGREREGTLPVADAVRTALRAGVRLLDCSPDYGTQREVGVAVAEALAAGEVSSRGKLFVVSSLSARGAEAAVAAVAVAGQGEHQDGLAAAAVRADVARTLAELGVEYLDALLLPYHPFTAVGSGGEAAVLPVWRALESLVVGGADNGGGGCGLVQHLGVAGFPVEALAALDQNPAVTRRPDVCLTELHPFYRDEALLAYCEERGVQVVAHSPLGRPGGRGQG